MLMVRLSMSKDKQKKIKNKAIQKTFCITGGNGFIGRKLIESLLNKGIKLRVLTRKKEVNFPEVVEVFNGDLTLPDNSLKEFLKGCDVLFHCAGEIRQIELMKKLHINGTQSLIDAVKEESFNAHKIIHWVQLSSCGAYGPPPKKDFEIKRKINEKTPTNPVNKYEKTKTLSDKLVLNACKNKEMTFTILRPSNVIGSNMTDQIFYKLSKALESGYFFFIGKKDATATFVHVHDVVNALVLIASDSRAINQIYNLSYDCSWEKMIYRITYLLKLKKPSLRIPAPIILKLLSILKFFIGKWKHIPNIEPLIFRTYYSSKKIQSELNFKFSIAMPEDFNFSTELNSK